MFDAGSTHTSLFVYRWPADKQNSTGVVSQALACQVKGQEEAPSAVWVWTAVACSLGGIHVRGGRSGTSWGEAGASGGYVHIL